jgi:FlaA1/EpsC-like NDP-sugar epimerase
VTSLDARAETYLLGRAPRAGLTPAARAAFAGRRVLITGAGGSVGSELARRVIECGPSQLVLLDHAEYSLVRIARELEEHPAGVPIGIVLGDVSRAEDVDAACVAHRPEYVFHAAACKHVSIAEEQVLAAIRTNVLGAVYTARAAHDIGARFVLISTDKAAQPHSVMGATKRLAELCVLDARAGGEAVAVRFGNVLGSSGSVVERLLDEARAGRPLTVTDPGATRFFMTAGEAASLVLKAAAAGERGDVFWLDMGKPLRLGDLVERIIDIAVPPGATRPAVRVVGLRPGEKRNEELTTRDLSMTPTEDGAIWRARQRPAIASMPAVVEQIEGACANGDAALALLVLQRTITDYQPSAAARAAAHRVARQSRLRRAGLATVLRTADARLRRPA